MVKFSACTLSATDIEYSFFTYLAMTIWGLSVLEDLLKDLKAGRTVFEEDMKTRLQSAAKDLGRMEVCLQQVSYMVQGPSLENAWEDGREEQCAAVRNELRWEKEKYYGRNAELV